MTEPASNRITVSEDKLDAKLAKLELSLVDRITKELERKADAGVVRELRDKVGLIQSSFEQQIARLDKEVREIRESQAGQKALSAAQKFWFGTVGVGVVSGLGTLVWLASSH